MAEHLRPVVEPIRSIDIHDLIAEPGSDEPDWLIEGLIERQGRVLLAGDEGSGKSLLSQMLAFQAAAGVKVLGQWTVPVGLRIAYFELEMSRRTLRRRSRLMNLAVKNAGGEVPSGELHLLHFPLGLNIGPRSRDAAEILQFVANVEPDLVIFDPLYRMASTDGMGEGEARPLIDFVSKVRELGAATWIVHHTRKRSGPGDRLKDSSDIYGNSILLRWPDTIAGIYDDGGRRGRFKVFKDREAFFEDQREWILQRGGEAPISVVRETPLNRSRLSVVDRLRMEGARSASALAKDLEMRKDDVLSAIRALEADGIVERVGSGPRTSWKLTEGGEVANNVISMFRDPPEEEQ